MEQGLSELLAKRPNLERYMGFMNSSVADKLRVVLPLLESYEATPQPVFLMVGAGTGKLEKVIAEALPKSRLIALDLSMPMLETIASEIRSNEGTGDTHEIHEGRIEILEGDARDIPLARESVDSIIAFSVVHEIASYEDGYAFGAAVDAFLSGAARVLKPKGRLIIRDFMQPKDPNEEIIVSVGKVQSDTDMAPTEFVKRFAQTFTGDDLTYIQKQIERYENEDTWKEGASLRMKASHALEVAAHYSWAQSFNEEVKEKYAYMPLEAYKAYVLRAFYKAEMTATVVAAHSYLQPGYPEHILGRLNFSIPNGEPYPLPDITGVIAVEKQ